MKTAVHESPTAGASSRRIAIAAASATAPPIIALRGVSRRFGDGGTAVRAVRDATFAIAAGEVAAIMGPSGSGKSTLLSLMGGLLDPDSGVVALAGQDLGALPPAARTQLRRTRFGFVFQKFNLLKALTALENVEIGLLLAGMPPSEARPRALRALAEVGLAPRQGHLPKDLSGGEQQRVAVARALAPLPSLILADEPTGALDSVSGRLVIDLIRNHVHERGAAAVIVTHDHRVATVVDRLLWMEDGALHERSDAIPPDIRALAG